MARGIRVLGGLMMLLLSLSIADVAQAQLNREACIDVSWQDPVPANRGEEAAYRNCLLDFGMDLVEDFAIHEGCYYAALAAGAAAPVAWAACFVSDVTHYALSGYMLDACLAQVKATRPIKCAPTRVVCNVPCPAGQVQNPRSCLCFVPGPPGAGCVEDWICGSGKCDLPPGRCQ